MDNNGAEHTDMSQALMLDGNAVAGLLDEIFGVEMTASPTECASCGREGALGTLWAFTQAPGVVTIVHTEVPQELGGRGVGTALARGVLEDVRRRGLKVVVRCSFIRAFMTKNPEFNDLLA